MATRTTTPKIPKATKTCSIEGCDRPLYGRELCNPHYQQAKRGKIPFGAKRKFILSPCAFTGCLEASAVRKFCKTHYSQARRGLIAFLDQDTNPLAFTCTVTGCLQPFYARTLCKPHYEQAKKGKIPGVIRPKDYAKSPEERLWANVNKNGPVPEVRPDLGQCWLWEGCRNNKGYGTISTTTNSVLTHRVAYEEAHGPVPSKLVLDHLCQVRHCCRPSHLEIVTHQINNQRGRGNGGKTHCKHGHEFTAENTYIQPSGYGRVCKACAALRYKLKKPPQNT